MFDNCLSTRFSLSFPAQLMSHETFIDERYFKHILYLCDRRGIESFVAMLGPGIIRSQGGEKVNLFRQCSVFHRAQGHEVSLKFNSPETRDNTLRKCYLSHKYAAHPQFTCQE